MQVLICPNFAFKNGSQAQRRYGKDDSASNGDDESGFGCCCDDQGFNAMAAIQAFLVFDDVRKGDSGWLEWPHC